MGVAGIRNNIKFGRIFGSGRLDYLYIKEGTNWYDIYAFENQGGGGTKRKGDGDSYCDMRGTGSDDYVWIYQDGHAAEIYANLHQPPGWGHSTKMTLILPVPSPRIGIHLADWDGDGLCDVLTQDRASGALTLYKNTYDKGSDTVSFIKQGIVTPGTCTQGWGVGIFDRGMRVVDLDGDGRADPLCIEPNGRITAWLNTKSGMVDVGQVKFSEGW
jgi:hypothetical protein